jgi:ketosteroid isomerase-like protein
VEMNFKMKRIAMVKAGIVSMVVLLASSDMALASVSSAEPPAPASCAAPDYRQFDFWAGDWEVFDIGSRAKVAHARVDLILDGCVLREDYQGADGHKGQSFTIYDATRKVWHQSWVTNRGELLIIEGKIEDGEMVLSGEDHAKSVLVRGTWKPMNGNVREIAATSTDGGKTWKPWFDLVFRPAMGATEDKARSSDAGDSKIVAALDTQYQAAVKDNDTATMGRILADDFVLVTGSGKAYTKADLLAEARSGRVHYERQDDTDQAVRVWGDTAVITAKLWEKGLDDGKPFEYTVWFSDTYVRTPAGWRYVFGQASLHLPKPPD